MERNGVFVLGRIRRLATSDTQLIADSARLAAASSGHAATTPQLVPDVFRALLLLLLRCGVRGTTTTTSELRSAHVAFSFDAVPIGGASFRIELVLDPIMARPSSEIPPATNGASADSIDVAAPLHRLATVSRTVSAAVSVASCLCDRLSDSALSDLPAVLGRHIRTAQRERRTLTIALTCEGFLARTPVRARQLALLSSAQRTLELQAASLKCLWQSRLLSPAGPQSFRVIRHGALTQLLLATSAQVEDQVFARALGSVLGIPASSAGHTGSAAVRIVTRTAAVGSVEALGTLLEPSNGGGSFDDTARFEATRAALAAAWRSVVSLGFPATATSGDAREPFYGCPVLTRLAKEALARSQRRGARTLPSLLLTLHLRPSALAVAVPLQSSTADTGTDTGVGCIRAQRGQAALASAVRSWAGHPTDADRLVVARAALRALRGPGPSAANCDRDDGVDEADDDGVMLTAADGAAQVADLATAGFRYFAADGVLRPSTTIMGAFRGGGGGGGDGGCGRPSTTATKPTTGVESAPVFRDDRRSDAAPPDDDEFVRSTSSLAELLQATVDARRTGIAMSAATTASSAAANETRSRAQQALPAATRRPTLATVQAVERAAQWGGRRFLVGLTPGGAVVVADQHGVSERIRLDRFVPLLSIDNAHLQHERPVSVVRHTLVPSSLPIPAALVAEVRRFRGALAAWHFGTADDAPDGGDSDDLPPLLLLSVPAIYVEGAARVPRRPIEALSEAVAAMRETHDATAAPPCLHRLLVDRSCRGAIMFGDTLTDGTAARLFQSATNATQFDLCSHGRPTLAHVATLPIMQRHIAASSPSDNPYVSTRVFP